MGGLLGRGNPRSLRTVALLLALVVLVTSVVIGGRSVQAAPQGTGYDGKAIFKGVYFAQGPLGDELSEYFKNVRKPTEGVLRAQDRWMGKIAAKDPSFFREFRADMSSGDRIRIQEALERGSWRLAEVVGAEQGIGAQELRAGNTASDGRANPGDETGKRYVYRRSAVAVYAVGVGVVVVVAFAFDTTPRQEVGENQQLEGDRFVNDIAVELRAA